MKTSRIEYLLSKASSLPKRPGVYLMKDAAGKVIYVGKSKVLKKLIKLILLFGKMAVNIVALK